MRALCYISWMAAGLAAVSCAPCDRHCQCTPDVPMREIGVIYDWSRAPGASPEGMAVLIYDTEAEGAPWRYDLRPAGGHIDVPQSPCRAITYNNDTEAITFDSPDDYFRYRAYTREGNLFDGLSEAWYGPLPKSRSDAGQRILIQPDPLWLYSTDDLKIDSATTTFTPVTATARYTYTIDGIDGLDGVARMCAAITGLSGELYLADMHKGSEAVTVPGCLRQASPSSATGNILTWGRADDNCTTNRLQLFIWLTDGHKYCYDFDVTGQIINAPDPLAVNISINGLDLPAPDSPDHGGSGGGIGVDVDNWETIEIELSN